jgi:N-methylhydantoinase B
MTVDPITLEIVRNGLVAVAEQISTRMIRSATAVIVKEMEDCSGAVFDGQGRLLSESASIPIHLNCIGLCLRTIMDHYIPLYDWHPGDVVITNDPYAGPTSLSSHHTNDIIAFSPVFWRDRLVAITALNTHHTDVGATWMASRGWNVEIEQEGLRIPPVKIVRRGETDRQMLALVLNNTRVPESLENDLTSQIASITLAGAEVIGLFDRYGRETLEACFDALMAYSERRTREEIGKIPDGIYRHQEVILDDGERGGPYKLCLELTVSGDEMTFDFTDTDPQIAGPINAPLSATYAATFYVVRCITDPSIPNTEGCKRPIHIVAPAGTLVNAQWPAACIQRMVVCHPMVDLVMGALSEAVPDRVMADSCGCMYNDTSVKHPKTGQRIAYGEVVPGGIGATALADGANVLSCHVTNCPIPPIEATEIEAPALFMRREFHVDSGGPGRFRGGLGQVLSYRVLAPESRFAHTSQKSVVPPQGVHGGRPGKSGYWLINEGKNSEQRLRYAIGDLEILDNGDTITHYGAGGGGYGSPLVRPSEAVFADIQDGLISLESAKVDYGVVLAANGRSIDQAATSVLRQNLLARCSIVAGPDRGHT